MVTGYRLVIGHRILNVLRVESDRSGYLSKSARGGDGGAVAQTVRLFGQLLLSLALDVRLVLDSGGWSACIPRSVGCGQVSTYHVREFRWSHVSLSAQDERKEEELLNPVAHPFAEYVAMQPRSESAYCHRLPGTIALSTVQPGTVNMP